MTITLIAILVGAVVIVGLLSALFFLGAWKPFGEVVGSGILITNEEFIRDFSSVDASSGFNVELSNYLKCLIYSFCIKPVFMVRQLSPVPGKFSRNRSCPENPGY